MSKWKCTVCGYVHAGESPPKKCPVCGADQNKFTLLADEGTTKEQAPSPDTSPASAPEPQSIEKPESPVRQWRCTVCGYIHKGEQPPDKCPVCGADKSKFVPVESKTSEQVSVAGADATKTRPPGPEDIANIPGAVIGENTRTQLSRLITRLHGHPIAVHVPNGVLPLSVLFLLLAIVFESKPLSIAASYNMMFIVVAMPVVLMTGYIDWQNRFEGRMSQVFLIKMICGAIVSMVSLILAIWWLANPDIYLSPTSSRWFFFFLHLLDLVAAATAGFYGGKLVFPPNTQP